MLIMVFIQYDYSLKIQMYIANKVLVSFKQMYGTF